MRRQTNYLREHSTVAAPSSHARASTNRDDTQQNASITVPIHVKQQDVLHLCVSPHDLAMPTQCRGGSHMQLPGSRPDHGQALQRGQALMGGGAVQRHVSAIADIIVHSGACRGRTPRGTPGHPERGCQRGTNLPLQLLQCRTTTPLSGCRCMNPLNTVRLRDAQRYDIQCKMLYAKCWNATLSTAGRLQTTSMRILKTLRVLLPSGLEVREPVRYINTSTGIAAGLKP